MKRADYSRFTRHFSLITEETLSKFNGSYIPKSALVIHAHPDDAEFTIGATLAKWAAAGLRDHAAVVSPAATWARTIRSTRAKTLAKTREAEQMDVAHLLGIKHVVFLRHDDCAVQPRWS